MAIVVLEENGAVLFIHPHQNAIITPSLCKYAGDKGAVCKWDTKAKQLFPSPSRALVPFIKGLFLVLFCFFFFW